MPRYTDYDLALMAGADVVLVIETPAEHPTTPNTEEPAS